MTRWLLALAACVTVAGPAFAQNPGQLTLRGGEIFAGVLHFHGLEPCTPAEFARVPPGERVIIFVGSLEDGPERGFPLVSLGQQTLRGGGSVLLALQGSFSNDANLRAFFRDGTRFVATGTEAGPWELDRCFDNDSRQPFAVPRAPNPAALGMMAAGISLPDPAMFLAAGLNRIATPGASLLAGPTGGDLSWSVVADLPPAIETRANPRPVRSRFAVASTGAAKGVPSHRVLVMTSPGLFGNRLMYSEATDNLAFANNVVRWLSVDGDRKKCLLVDGGRVVPKFDTVLLSPAPPPAIPPIPIPDFLDPTVQSKFTNMVNEALNKMEANNTLNKLLVDADDDRALRKFLIGFATVAAVLALFFVMRKVLGAKHAPDLTAAPREAGRLASSGGPGSLARKKEELLQLGDYGPLVRDYLRDWFAGRGGTPGAELPPVRVAPGADGKTLRASLRILWGIAHRRDAVAMPYSRWRQTEPLIHAVQEADAAGRWRFETTKDSA